MYKHYFAEGNTLTEAYHQALKILHANGDIVPCPDYSTNIKEIGITFFVKNAIQEPFISKLSIASHIDLAQYELEITEGILDFKIGDGNCWEYTYCARFINQLPFIYSELKRNPDSRRAIMSIRDFDVDSNTEHPACLQSIQFLIRNNRLNMQVMMRSNDAVQATFSNCVGFIALQRKVAKNLGLTVGSYTHTAHSFHVYERNFPLLESYVNTINTHHLSDITYNYSKYDEKIDCSFKEMMEESIPAIMKQVQKLKDEMAIR